MHHNNLPELISAAEEDYFYLDPSGIQGAGKGLYTAILIYPNEIISLFKGEILSSTEASKRAAAGEDGYFINMLDGSIMDSKNIDCFAKYANDAHGKSTGKVTNNARIGITETEEVCLIATRKIKEGEEIFCAYGTAYWKNRK